MRLYYRRCRTDARARSSPARSLRARSSSRCSPSSRRVSFDTLHSRCGISKRNSSGRLRHNSRPHGAAPSAAAAYALAAPTQPTARKARRPEVALSQRRGALGEHRATARPGLSARRRRSTSYTGADLGRDTAVTESRYSKHARNLSLSRKPSTRRSLKKLSSFRRLGAAGVRLRQDGRRRRRVAAVDDARRHDAVGHALLRRILPHRLFTHDELKWVVCRSHRGVGPLHARPRAVHGDRAALPGDLLRERAGGRVWRRLARRDPRARRLHGRHLPARHCAQLQPDVVNRAILHTRKPDIARHYTSAGSGSTPSARSVGTHRDGGRGGEDSDVARDRARSGAQGAELLRMDGSKFLERFEGAAHREDRCGSSCW